ncbi:MAG: enoyl-CoA hydratase/isomerase family protein [Acidobacteriota bacterium]
MGAAHILYEVEGGIATLTINRPGKLNALNRRTMDEIGEAVATAAAASQVRALVITGAGEKAFVAGADIGELREQTPVGGRQTSQHGQEILRSLEHLGKPAIAAINGYALGGGLELALACHIRIAAENARLGLPEVGLGIIPGYGGTQRLARLIGRGRAIEMILTGRQVKAHEAAQMGLVNRVVPEGKAMEKALGLAGTILEKGPMAVTFALQAISSGLEMPLNEGQELEACLFGLISSSRDMKEGLEAFLEKRPPRFDGK